MVFPVILIAGTSVSDIFYHITQDMNSFSTFFPLTEGSPGEKKAVQFIKTRLSTLNVQFSQYNLNKSEDFHSESFIIDAFFKGNSTDEILFIFPLNTSEESSGETSAFNLATALMLAETLRNNQLHNSVHLLFMGAEYGKEKEYPLGTQEYLNLFYPESNTAFFYCNIIGIPETISVSASGTGNISPLWLLRKSINSLKKAEIPFSFHQEQNFIYRLKLNEHPSIIDSYLDNNYPTILFQNENRNSEINSQNIQRYYTFLYDLAADRDWNVPPDSNWDKHYLFMRLGSSFFFLKEQNYVLFLIILFSLILLYPFLAGGRFKKYTRTITGHFWTIPILFFITFLFLVAATYTVQSILFIRSFQTLWKEEPVMFFLFKLLFSSFLFLISIRVFEVLKFSYRGSFYSAAAMLFIILDVLLICAIDISFAFYLVPVLFAVFLFTIVRSKWIKLIFLILSAAILIIGIVKMFYAGSFNVIHIFLLSPVYGNLLITANLLPILMMIYRLRFLFHHADERHTKKMILIFDLTLGFTSVLMYIYLSIFNPFSNNNPQPVTVTENISVDEGIRLITLQSPAPLGNFTFNDNLFSAAYKTKSNRLNISSSVPGKLPHISLTKTRFLNRSRYSLIYKDSINPNHIEVKLISDRGIIIYDSNFPYRESGDATRIIFTTGFYPPPNFYLTFTIPGDFNGELIVTGEYTPSDNSAVISDHAFAVKRVQYIKKKLLITNSD